jgi:hypothetical protein
MYSPTFLLFTPVPLRARADGWSPAVQLRFLEALARGLSVSDAAAEVGRNRQTVYTLRRRKGAESFVAAWDAAVAYAASARSAPPRDDPAARAAYAQLVRKLLGSESDTQAREKNAYEKPNFPNLPGDSVAFRGARLRRPPC